MAEKKGGLKVFVWVFSFLVVVGVGWFALTKFSAVQLKGKIDSGEAILVSMTVGQVDAKKGDGSEWNPLYSDDTLQMGDVVRTGIKSYCELQMVNKGMFRVEGDTELIVASLIGDNGKMDAKIKLSKGQVAIKPKKLDEGEVFQVETSSAIAAVRGTTFSITVDDEGSTKVAVSEGKVSVTPKIKSIENAEKKGQISKDSMAMLNEELVKSVDVVPGEEMVLDQKKIQTMDKAIGQAIEEVAKESGPITGEKMMASKAEISGAIVTKAMAVIVDEGDLKVSPKEMVNAYSISASVVTKQVISEESKKTLEMVSEDKIVKDIEQLAKITIDATPSGAEVYLNDEFIGLAPVQKLVVKEKTYNLLLVKEGYNNYTSPIKAGQALNVSMKVEIQPVAAAQTNAAVPVATNAVTPVVAPENVIVPETDKPKVDKPKVDKPKVDKPKVDKPVVDKDPIVEPEKTPVVQKPKAGDLIWNKAIDITLSAGSINDPVYYEGKIYTTAGNNLYILSKDGTVLKSIAISPSDQTLTRPEVGNGLIMVGSDKGKIYAYKPNGDLAWKSDSGSPAFPSASPVAGGGVVAVPTMDKGLQVFDKNGSLKASVETKEVIFSSPIILKGGSLLVYANDTGDVIGYDIASKTKIWTQSFGIKRITYPFVGNDSVVVILDRSSGLLIGFNPETGKELWRTTIGDLKSTEVNPVYDEGYVILVNASKTTVYAVKASSGSKVLDKDIKGKITGKPYVNKKVVYIGTSDGTVIGYDLGSKKEVVKFSPEKGSGEVTIVVADSEGVYSVDDKGMTKIQN